MKKLDVNYYPGKDYKELFDITIDSGKCTYTAIGIRNDGVLLYIDSKMMNNSSAYWGYDQIFTINKEEFRHYLELARENGQIEKAIKQGHTTEDELECLCEENMGMDINIRPIIDTDYDRVSLIMNQVHQLHVNWRPDVYKDIDPVISPEDFTEMLKTNEWFVAEADGVVAGIMKLLERQVQNPLQKSKKILHISTMAVDEKYRGRGIGHAFFQMVKEIKEEKEFDSIELQVNAKNTRAFEMYKKYGFTEKTINMELQ